MTRRPRPQYVTLTCNVYHGDGSKLCEIEELRDGRVQYRGYGLGGEITELWTGTPEALLDALNELKRRRA